MATKNQTYPVKLSSTMRFRAPADLFSRIEAIARRNNRKASDQARLILQAFADREEKKFKA